MLKTVGHYKFKFWFKIGQNPMQTQSYQGFTVGENPPAMSEAEVIKQILLEILNDLNKQINNNNE